MVPCKFDQIKEHTPGHIMDGYLWGEGWLLVKRNEREAVIEHHSLYMLHQLPDLNYRVLAFWQPSANELEDPDEVVEDEDEDRGFITELQQLRLELMMGTRSVVSTRSSTFSERASETISEASNELSS